MTPPDFFCFVLPWSFLETGAQQLSEWVRIPLCPELSVALLPWAVPESQGCPPGCARPGVPLFVLSLWPTALELCQCKTCSLPWLKAVLNTAGWAPEQSNFVFSSKVHLHFCCISEQMPRWGSYKWPRRQSVINLNSFSLGFIQIGNLVLSLVFPSPIAILHPKGCLWKQGSMHVWARVAALKQGVSTQSLGRGDSSYIWSLQTEPMSLCLVTFR